MSVGIQNGILYHGVLRINEQNPSEGFVLCRFGIEMMIVGDRNINRALHGDMVAVQPYNHGKGTDHIHLDLRIWFNAFAFDLSNTFR